MKATLAGLAYSTLLQLATPLYMTRLLWRSRREPLYRAHLGERLGFAALHAEGTGSTHGAHEVDAAPPLWLHAVSLGETRAAAALIDELRRQRPGLRLLLTHGTATGRAAGAPLLRPGDVQAWLPYDTPGAVRRFFAAHRPVAGVLMETEIWPNLLAAAEAAGVPVVLANARLSERSLRKGERLAPLLRPAARRIAAALAQTDGDAQRLRAAGVRDVAVLGNLKFDMTPAPALLAAGRAWRAALHAADPPRPVVMFAASREGEEAMLLAAWTRAGAVASSPGAAPSSPGPLGPAAVPASPASPASPPAPLLLIVPRHPQRFDEVAALAAAARTAGGRGLVVVRRSAFGAAAAAPGPPPAEVLAALRAADVCIGDTLGEMPLFYAAADAALLGGSFAPLGGQNLIEAAACGCPVLMGPHTFNFGEAAELALAAGAAERVPDLDTAVARALAWLGEPAALAARAVRATAFAASHRGAAARMAAAVLACFPVEDATP
ncbi:MAG: 3-deoxy-D-manno-octulosonic acid transferase [Betaproteobacteria bacterium]|nr:3-deoxy-D-manno-octulosonic acid transferase [Betaproteobacteria bacterium]